MSIKHIIIIFMLSVVFFSPSKSLACWGARPLAMGGAFVAVGGDINGVYWNPAGLATVTQEQFTWTSGLDSLDAINYDDFFALVLPIDNLDSKENRGTRTIKPGDHKTFGLAVVLDENRYYSTKYIDRYFNFSYGFPVKNQSNLPLYLGVNLKTIYKEIEWFEYEEDANDTSCNTLCGSDSDNTFLIDFGLLMKMSSTFSLGLLVQNANEPEIFNQHYIRNVRLGFALNPNPATTLTLEVYDLFGRSEDDDVTRNLRLGFESWLTPYLALRGGGYNINSDNPGTKAFTGGIVWRIRNWELNYTAMDFYKLSDLKWHHMAGLTYTF